MLKYPNPLLSRPFDLLSKKSLTEGSKGEPHCCLFFFFAEEHCSDFWVAELHCSDFRRFDGSLDVKSKVFRLECEVVSLLELSSKSSEPHCSVFFFSEEHCSDVWVAELHCSDFRRFDGRLEVESKALHLECEVASLSKLCSKSSESSMSFSSRNVEIFSKIYGAAKSPKLVLTLWPELWWSLF